MARRSEQTVKPPVPPKATTPKVRIGFARSADKVFKKLPKSVRDGLLEKIKAHILNPTLGKPLIGELQGCCRVSYGRIRAVVRLAENAAVGLVIAVGPRKEGSKDDPYVVGREYLASDPAEIYETIVDHIRSLSAQETLANSKKAK